MSPRPPHDLGTDDPPIDHDSAGRGDPEPAAGDPPTTDPDGGPDGPVASTSPVDERGPTMAEIDQAAAAVGARMERLVEELIEVELETGRREETVEEAERHLVVRVVRIVGGVVVLVLGLAMLALPGPGLLAIAIGLGLLAQDVPFARRWLDTVKARLPQDEDGKLPTSTIVMMVAVSVAAVAGSLWFTFFRS